jgi:hypothetical protein
MMIRDKEDWLLDRIEEARQLVKVMFKRCKVEEI